MALDLDRFEEHLRGARAPRTARTYSQVARDFALLAGSGGGGAPNGSTVERFLGRQSRDGAPRSAATKNQELAALRALSKFARRSGIWDSDPTDGIPYYREPQRSPTVLTASELRRLFEVVGRDPRAFHRARNLAILAVLSQAGLRVHELVGLELDQFDQLSRTLLGVTGKGGTRFDVPLNAEATALLASWLDERSGRVGPNEPALFISLRGSRLSIRSVERLMERLRAQLGTKKKVTPHTFRHSAATIALVLGADLSTVGDLLRHADLNVTRRYLHLVDERTREAVRRLGTTVPDSVLPAPRLHLVEGAQSRGQPQGQAHFPVDDQYPLGAGSAPRLSSASGADSGESRHVRGAEPPKDLPLVA